MHMSDQMHPGATRAVALAGATGLVGSAILQGLLDDPTVAAVHAIGRRRPDTAHPKLVAHVVDLAALPPLPAFDEVYLALGTTIRVAGSQAAFRAVDLDANLAVARAARALGASRAGLVSAMGADARSRIFYNRVKGELEEALAGLAFPGLVIARPSLLLGDRQRLGQARRTFEGVAMVASRFIGPLFPANLRPIAGTDVARALLARVPKVEGREVLLSGDMQP
jgi:uncharacterized protein YbjT (DUF2867 family)